MILRLHLTAGLPGDAETEASVAGDVLTVDGHAYDLSAVPEGGEAMPQGLQHPFIGPITRFAGEISAALVWRYDAETAEAEQGSVHPVAIVSKGPVPDPVTRRPIEREADV
jgi:hypothetical protein